MSTFKDALTLFRAGKYDDASELFFKIVEEDEENHRAWNALGVCLSKVGNLEQAGHCFENATILDPGNLTYEKNLDSNIKKLKPKKNSISNVNSARIRHESDYEYGEPKATDSRPFWLGIIGMFIGGIVGIAGLFFGALSAVFGGVNLVGWGFIAILFSIVGFIGSIIKPKQYGIILLVISSVFILISTIGFGIIASLMFISSAYLIYRSIYFESGYFFNFKQNGVKKAIFTVGILLLIYIGFIGLSSISVSSKDSLNPVSAEKISSPIPKTDFSTVTHGSVTTITKNWDSSAEDDGLMIFPDLLDSRERTVEWSGVELPVDVEIYTTKFNDNFKMVKDRQVYFGSGKIASSDDGNMFLGGGLKLPFSSMDTTSEDTSGTLNIKVHLPDGRVIEAVENYVSLQP